MKDRGRFSTTVDLDDERYCPTCDVSFAAGQPTCPRCRTSLVSLQPSTDPLVGRDLDGRYRIDTLIGAGGMGRVYRAWQASVARNVAVKIMAQSHAASKETVKRFLREARLASRLSQPNTVAVHDFGRAEDGTLYLVMEWLEGQTVRDLLAKAGPLEPLRTIQIGIQLCDALEAAHSLGIVHRDLKPANVMILDHPPGRDLIKVLDFGLAKLSADSGAHETTITALGTPGTPAYMAPESWRDEPATPATDLYALGAMLFELLRGAPPFFGNTLAEVRDQHLTIAAPDLPKDVPLPLGETVARLLAKAPGERPRCAATVRDALVAARHAVSIERHGQSPSTAGIEARTPRRWVWILAGALLVATAAWLTLQIFPNEQPIPASVPPPAAPPAKEPGRVRLVLRAHPAAEVFLGKERLGTTPLRHDVARTKTPVVLRFVRDGYLPLRHQVVPSEGQEIEVTLVRRQPGPRRPKKKPPRVKPEKPKLDFILPAQSP